MLLNILSWILEILLKLKKNIIEKKDFKFKKTNFKKNIKNIDPNWKPKILGKIIYKLINYYVKNNIYQINC